MKKNEMHKGRAISVLRLTQVSVLCLLLSACKSSQDKDKKADLNDVMNAGYHQGVKETAEQIRDVYQRQGGYGSREHAAPVMTTPRAAACWVPPTVYRELDLVAQGRWVDLKIRDSDWMLARRNEVDPYSLAHLRVVQRDVVLKDYEKDEPKSEPKDGAYPFPVKLNDDQRTKVETFRRLDTKKEANTEELKTKGPLPEAGQTIEFDK